MYLTHKRVAKIYGMSTFAGLLNVEISLYINQSDDFKHVILFNNYQVFLSSNNNFSYIELLSNSNNF